MQLAIAMDTETVTATAQNPVSSQCRFLTRYPKPWRSVSEQNQRRFWRHLITVAKEKKAFFCAREDVAKCCRSLLLRGHGGPKGGQVLLPSKAKKICPL